MHLQVSHLSKSFSGSEILSDVSFTISGSDRIALIGDNGSGKSTLLNIIMGQQVADSGYIIKHPDQVSIGFLPQVLDNNSSLSSGQKLKASLEHILAENPDLLLLDEPTNHLDWPGMDWLENIISSFSGPVLLVSHDRYFIDRVANRILDLENGQIHAYGGNYSFFKHQKQIQIESASRAYQDQQSRLKKLSTRALVIKNRTQQLEASTTGADHYVRRKAAKQSRSALAMEKRIQKELSESTLTPPSSDWHLRALFTPRQISSPTVVSLKSVSYSNILTCLNLTITKNSRWSLLGNNGSGKTTLIKLILGELSPDQGNITFGNGVETGYLSQEHQELNADHSILDELSGGSVDRTECYKLLHRFLLSPEKINQSVNSLSSGEKAKLLLAKIMTRGANLIILDEPTNHLDIPSREALESALLSYSGTLIIASHDRQFLQNIGITDTLQLFF